MDDSDFIRFSSSRSASPCIILEPTSPRQSLKGNLVMDDPHHLQNPTATDLDPLHTPDFFHDLTSSDESSDEERSRGSGVNVMEPGTAAEGEHGLSKAGKKSMGKHKATESRRATNDSDESPILSTPQRLRSLLATERIAAAHDFERRRASAPGDSSRDQQVAAAAPYQLRNSSDYVELTTSLHPGHTSQPPSKSVMHNLRELQIQHQHREHQKRQRRRLQSIRTTELAPQSDSSDVSSSHSYGVDEIPMTASTNGYMNAPTPTTHQARHLDLHHPGRGRIVHSNRNSSILQDSSNLRFVSNIDHDREHILSAHAITMNALSQAAEGNRKRASYANWHHGFAPVSPDQHSDINRGNGGQHEQVLLSEQHSGQQSERKSNSHAGKRKKVFVVPPPIDTTQKQVASPIVKTPYPRHIRKFMPQPSPLVESFSISAQPTEHILTVCLRRKQNARGYPSKTTYIAIPVDLTTITSDRRVATTENSNITSTAKRGLNRLRRITGSSSSSVKTPHVTDFDDTAFFRELHAQYVHLAGPWRNFSARKLSRITVGYSSEPLASGNHSLLSSPDDAIHLLSSGHNGGHSIITNQPPLHFPRSPRLLVSKGLTDTFSEEKLMQHFRNPSLGRARYAWVHWAQRLAGRVDDEDEDIIRLPNDVVSSTYTPRPVQGNNHRTKPVSTRTGRAKIPDVPSSSSYNSNENDEVDGDDHASHSSSPSKRSNPPPRPPRSPLSNHPHTTYPRTPNDSSHNHNHNINHNDSPHLRPFTTKTNQFENNVVFNLDLIESLSITRILCAVLLVSSLAVAATLVWIFVGVGGGAAPGSEIAAGYVNGGAGGAGGAGGKGRVATAPARVGTGLLLGGFVLAMGWTGVGVWVWVSWLVL